jgi:hypothetical protein
MRCFIDMQAPKRAVHKHCGSWSDCGGNPKGTIHGARSTGGPAQCGLGCNRCGAGTHWTCCGCDNAASTRCLRATSRAQARKNHAFYCSSSRAISGPMAIADISELEYGAVSQASLSECRSHFQCFQCFHAGVRALNNID